MGKVKSKLVSVKNFLLASLVVVGFTILCFLPSELFLVIRYLLKPVGFWQNLAVFGLGFWILGVFQFMGLISWCFVMYGVIFGGEKWKK
jgi:hypothetical protein